MEKEDRKRDAWRRRDFLRCAGLAGMGLLPWPRSSWAVDVYPAKSLTWLIYTKPGGGLDLFARAMAPFLAQSFKSISPGAKGGAVRIRNEPAGGGEKAVVTLYHSPPDGYTIGSFVAAFLAEKHLIKKDYDIAKLTYLVRLNDTTRLIVTGKNGPKSWDELVAASKQAPIKWAVGNFGRELHITSIVANDAIGLPVKFIPFGGGTIENINALMRGDVQVTLISDDSAKTLLDAGELKVLLSFDKKSIYPGAPSVQDLGHPQLINLTKGHRLLAGPPGMPAKMEKTIANAFQQASRAPEFLQWCKQTGFEFNPLYGNDLRKLVREVDDYYRNKAPLIKKYLS